MSAACSEGPLGPDDQLLVEPGISPLQLAPPLSPPPEQLRVVVRRISDLTPVEDVEVRWQVIVGTGLTLSAATSRTDSAGVAFVGVVLGPEKGRYLVRARAGVEATDFELWAVDTPLVDSVPARARPGDTIRISGHNFSPVLEHDLVRFGNVRARITRATGTELTVEVPPCLPAGSVPVRVSLGVQTSAARSTLIEVAGSTEGISVGRAITLDGAGQGTASCRRLPPGSYLLVLASAGTVSGARHPVRLATLGGTQTAAVQHASGPAVALPRGDPQTRWDARLRTLENGWLEERGRAEAGLPVARALAGAPPRLGDRREFSVLEPDGGFRRVAAVVRWVGARAAFYEDVETPAGQLTAADYAAFGAAFDDPIAPTVTRIFGEPSDVDGNERVVVLFTPAVNRLTERNGSDGFIGGFFYGLDLLTDRANSNRGEVFYAVVPDPDGQFGDRRSRDLVISTVPTILAHELMHMVHFSERVLGRGAPTGEALWLSEALAGMAEDRVGDAFAARGQAEVAAEFHAGNNKRARLFLELPIATSLITAGGGATLAERGASWLFLRYVAEQYGGDALLGTLTRTTRTGIANVTAATGLDWRGLVLDWATAVYDGEEAGVADPALAGTRYRYPVLRPRQALVAPGKPYALPVAPLDPRAATMDAELLAGAVSHYRVDAVAPVTVAVGGRPGWPLPTAAGVVLRVLRLK